MEIKIVTLGGADIVFSQFNTKNNTVHMKIIAADGKIHSYQLNKKDLKTVLKTLL